MSDTPVKANRQQRLVAKMRKEMRAEFQEAEQLLRGRSDYHPAFDYFLSLLPRGLDRAMLQELVVLPVVAHLCNQAPYEIFHALGLQPLRLACGGFSLARLAAPRLPVLMCPMLKSLHGLDEVQVLAAPAPRIIPTTCDWVVKFPELAIDGQPQNCFLDLPHLRHSERSQLRWREELDALIRFLEAHSGRQLERGRLKNSISLFLQLWSALARLIDLRRTGRIAPVWFMVVTNSFMLDRVENWLEALERLVVHLLPYPARVAKRAVCLSGSPIVFPNFKLLHLLEQAGLTVLADDLCTSERILPPPAAPEDSSVSGMLRSLAERYHRACQCPTFADNERRLNALSAILDRYSIQGVVHHVLKGCHPFEIESFSLERHLRERDRAFIKIETDYVQEDSRTLLTRLEAFARIERSEPNEERKTS